MSENENKRLVLANSFTKQEVQAALQLFRMMEKHNAFSIILRAAPVHSLRRKFMNMEVKAKRGKP